MSLIPLNSPSVKTGSAFLEGVFSEAASQTYIIDLADFVGTYGEGNHTYAAGVAVGVATFALGFLFVPMQVAYQLATGTRTFDQLVAKLAAKEKQVEYRIQDGKSEEADAAQTEVNALYVDLKTRVQRAVVANKDNTADIRTAAMAKLQQAYKAKNPSNDSKAIDFASKFAQDLGKEEIQRQVNRANVTSSGVNVYKAAKNIVNDVIENEVFSGKQKKAEKEAELLIGRQLLAKYPDTQKGQKEFDKTIQPLTNTQKKQRVQNEEKEAIATLKTLVRDYKELATLERKTQHTLEVANETLADIELGEPISRHNKKPTGLYLELADLEGKLRAEELKVSKKQDKVVIRELKGQIVEKQEEIAPKEKTFAEVEKKINALTKDLEKATAEKQHASEALVAHVRKFFDNKNIASKIVAAAKPTSEEEYEEGKETKAAAYDSKLPTDADLKKALNAYAINQKIEAKRTKDTDYRVAARKAAIDELADADAKRNAKPAESDIAKLARNMNVLTQAAVTIAKNAAKGDKKIAGMLKGTGVLSGEESEKTASDSDTASTEKSYEDLNVSGEGNEAPLMLPKYRQAVREALGKLNDESKENLKKGAISADQLKNYLHEQIKGQVVVMQELENVDGQLIATVTKQEIDQVVEYLKAQGNPFNNFPS